MKITNFTIALLAFAVGYLSLWMRIRCEIHRYDEKFYILLNKIHEIDKRMEIKFTQIDSTITK